MTRCKICKTNIPDGTEYCSNCQDKSEANSNESYLDSLLNSVKNTAPAVEDIYKKKTNTSLNHNENAKVIAKQKKENELAEPNARDIVNQSMDNELEESDMQNFESYSVDMSDIEDFDQFYMDDDLNNIPRDFVISDEELFGQDLSEFLSDQSESEKPIAEIENSQEAIKEGNSTVEENVQAEEIVKVEEKLPVEEIQQETFLQESMDNISTDNLKDNDENNDQDNFDDSDTFEADLNDNINDYINENIKEYQSDNIEEENIPEAESDYYNHKTELPNLEEEDDFDPDLNDLLNSLNTIPGDDVEEPVYKANNSSKDEDNEADYNFEQVEPEEDDFLSLLNQISSDDPVSEDVKAINDLLQGKPVEATRQSSTPSDVGEVFSDALKGITSLNDTDIDENELLDKIPEGKSKKGKKEKAKQEKKVKKDKKENSDSEDQPKKGLIQKLFGNVKDKNATKKKKAASDSKSDESAAAKEPKGKDAANSESGKKIKEKKPKKGATAKGGDGEETQEGSGKDKTANKKEKKENKKKSKELIQVIDEIEEDEGRINRLGASIVFIFFGLLVALILVGTKVVSYTISIQNATEYFDRQKYTEAYNEVYGIDIKDEDIEIYDKIMTVMFVNKQLNSYNNYYSIGEYPKALDSLLKGLQRYDKYIELATALGIDSDLDYVRTQILEELDNVFSLSEREAMKIISYDDMHKYSMAVYDVAGGYE